jgi:hypothetical protein
MLMIELTVIEKIVNVLSPEANLTNFCAIEGVLGLCIFDILKPFVLLYR